ncbi:DUF167 domain-containing protein [Belnapia rosea]|uniref:UPF0235 protein SAMN04487779_101858 n=1 Tax=Belnapia rosea TaxID=938405 RepID=A0A1G7A2A2_9PROT|nr:DUF167 domain-containing protein [Belnapia rosea]SDB69484.1 hypothetical protein SAMN02927895_03452 [Belnapia rosea]SDE08952.1 hypothetical protein SAMN04487779_101858 [Belnapia rosea]
MSDGWWRPGQDGLTLRVKVQPRARRRAIGGLAPGVDGPRLRLAVTEAAEDGRANRAVCAVLAEALGLPASSVTVLQGMTAREKLLQVAGDPAVLATKLKELA